VTCALVAIGFYVAHRRQSSHSLNSGDNKGPIKQSSSPVHRELKASPPSHIRTQSSTPLLNDTEVPWGYSQGELQTLYQDHDTTSRNASQREYGERTQLVGMRESSRSRVPLTPLIIPESPAAISAVTYAHANPVATVDVVTSASTPSSAGSSASVYSQRSASTLRQPTFDRPILPAMPPSSTHVPRQIAPPEEPPLNRGNTVVVARLLKLRAQKGGNDTNPLFAHAAQIERSTSINYMLSLENESPGKQSELPKAPAHDQAQLLPRSPSTASYGR